jgi:hypothetical protein
MQRIGFALLWLGFLLYAFLLAPPDDPNTTTVIQNLVTGQWQGINPFVIALFNILGVLPMAYACLMLFDGRGQRIRAFPFTVASFGVGAFALMPYLALRQSNPTFTGEKNLLLKLLDSRWTGGAIALSALALLLFGVVAGDWSDFVQQWQTSRFIHVMSLDLCLTSLLFPALLGDDMARREMRMPRLFWTLALLPLFGLLIYLVIRSPLKTSAQGIEGRSLQSVSR